MHRWTLLSWLRIIVVCSMSFHLSMLSHFQYFIVTMFASQIVYYCNFMKCSRLIQCIKVWSMLESSRVTWGRNWYFHRCKTNSQTVRRAVYDSYFATLSGGWARRTFFILKSSTMYFISDEGHSRLAFGVVVRGPVVCRVGAKPLFFDVEVKA